MGVVKRWFMTMAEDAYHITLEEYLEKHGEENIDIWRLVNIPSLETFEEPETINGKTSIDYIPF